MKSKLKSVKKLKSVPKVYEFKVTLLGTTPPVWRTFLAHNIIVLDELHLLIQMTMGWQNSHLHEFIIDEMRYGNSDPDFDDGVTDSNDVILDNVLGDTKSFSYTYDFGDGWQHQIEIIQTLKHDPNMNYPVCIGGENACPPEDCGGPPGFEDLKKTLAEKNSSKKSELLTWLGGFYSPYTFDPNIINKLLLWNDGDLYAEDEFLD